MRNSLYNSIWAFGVRARNISRRLGLLTPRMENGLRRFGHHLVPTHSAEDRLTVHGNMTLFVPPLTAASRSFASGQYEREVVRTLTRIAKSGMTAVDLGANVGYYTLLLSRLVGPVGSVYAFEPDPDLCAALRRNVALNNCTNARVVDKGVSDRIGLAIFVRARRRMGGFLALTPEALSRGEPVSVEVLTLDAYFGALDWPRVHLIKMDIEGGELAALRGMGRLVERNPELALIMEFNPDAFTASNSSGNKLSEALLALGFESGRVIEQNLRAFRVADLATTRSPFNALLVRS